MIKWGNLSSYYQLFLLYLNLMETTENTNINPRVGVRFFDPARQEDFERLYEIVSSPGARQWMSDVQGMKKKHFYEWMEETGKRNFFLFAVVIKEEGNPEDDQVQGFVYIYPCEWERGSLEISFAKKPGAPSGLIAPATKLACRFVREYNIRKTGRENPPLRILGEVEADNEPSKKVIWKSGFDLDEEYDEDDNLIFVANWERILGEG